MNSDNRPSNSFVKQAAILAAASIAVRILGFLYKLPLTDLIGDEGNAIYGIGYNVYNLFLVISSAGLPAAISKLVSEKRAIGRHDLAHRIFKISLLLAASVGALFMAVIFVFADEITALLGTPMAYLALQTLAPTVFIVAIMAVIRGYFQGMNSTVPTAISQVVEQVFNAIFSVVLAHTLWNYALRQGHAAATYGAAGGTAGTGVGAVAGLIVVAGLYFIARPDILRQMRYARRRNRNSNSNNADAANAVIVRNVSVTAFTIVAGTAIFSIANLIDSWLVVDRLTAAGLGDVRARELFGQLSAKFNPLTNLPAAISSSLAIALVPAIAASKALGDNADVQDKLNTALRVAMLLTFPIAFGFGVLGVPIVTLLFPNHPEGGTLLMLGFPSIIFLAASQIATGVLQAIGKTRIPVFAALIGAAVKLGVGYALMSDPRINIYGAIIGTTLMFLITAAINCFFLCKHTGARLDFVGMALKPAISAFAMALGCFVAYHFAYILLGSNAVAVAAAVLFGMMLYVAFMLLIKGFSAADIRFLPRGKKALAFLQRRGLM